MTVWSGYVGGTGVTVQCPAGSGGGWTGDGCAFQCGAPGKFAADQLGVRYGDYYLILSGVVYNRAELMRRCETVDWAAAVIMLFERDGGNWCRQLRGSFSGMIYHVPSRKLYLFTDHIGDHRVFFHRDEHCICFSSDLQRLLAILRLRGIKPGLDVNSAYSLLSFGFMLEDNTLLNEVKWLRPGQHLHWFDGHADRYEYYRLDNTPDSTIGFDEAVEELDRRFRAAVKLEYDKDEEVGLRHLAGLSGGLDARMALWVARDLGYDQVMSYTMGQSGCDDDRMASELASWLHVEHLFQSFDNGLFLRYLEETTAINPGMFLYYGLAHNYSLFRNLDMAGFGLVHSGQLGDVVIGSFIGKYRPGQPLPVAAAGVYSQGLSEKVRCDYAGFGNQELFLMYSRAFSGCLQGNSTIQYFGSEVASPFCDVDVMDFCFRLPLEYRVGHRLYFAWIKRKYPGAAQFKWTSRNQYIGDGAVMNFLHKLPRRAANQFLRLCGKPMIGSTFSRRHMNPLDLWYRDNTDLRLFMDTYFEQHLPLLASCPELQSDCRNHYLSGLATAKVQVLSLLAGVRQLLYPGEE